MAEQINTKPYTEITCGDHKYQVYPLTGRAVCHLDRKVTDIAYGFRTIASSKDDLGSRIVHVFAEMDDVEFDSIIDASLGNVVRLGNIDKGESNARVTLDNVFDFFKGDIDGLYGLLVQLWRAYELTPFVKAKMVAKESTGD